VRVLIGAFACRPGSGSEPGVGWAVATGAARAGHDVVVITQPRHRASIEAALASEPELALHLEFTYSGFPASVMDAWQRSARLRGLQLYYLVWQVALCLTARRLHRVTPFDVAHHVTLSNDWIPSGLSFIPGLPLVWGPLGGGERVPASCRRYLGFWGRVSEALRSAASAPLRAGLARPCARRASLLLAQNPEEAAHLNGLGTAVEVRPNVFLDESWFTKDVPRLPPKLERYRAIFVGRLLPWKGVHLALDVMRHPQVQNWELHFYGKGPARAALERTVVRHHMADRVVFHGALPREQVRHAMEDAHALLYPSMREAAGWVVAEALGVGCPVVCLDTAGLPQLLRGSGAAIPPGPEMAHQLADALVASTTATRSVVRWGSDAVPALAEQWYATARSSAVAAALETPV
jgi:glycosyltransferase involved in cell wall biosynthesis